MSRAAGWHDELQGRAPGDWPAFLSEHSGLPGPRANLPLVDAVAELASQATIDALLDSGDEYLVMCAAAALGRRADDPAVAARARALASDERWRVREGVAIGLQLLGDRDLPALLVHAEEWADDPDPLVGRAAVAAVCEPRLLRGPQATAAALALCQRLTARIAALRRGPDAGAWLSLPTRPRACPRSVPSTSPTRTSPGSSGPTRARSASPPSCRALREPVLPLPLGQGLASTA